MINPDSENNPLRKMRASLVPSITSDIGATLKRAREKRGHSLEVISQHTRISKRYLEAMESNRFEELPALAYLRSFLKTYCDYLEIDFEPLWKTVVSEVTHAEAPAAAPAAVPEAKTVPDAVKDAPPRKNSDGSERLIVYAALFAAAAFACLLLVWALTRRDHASPAAAVATPPAALEPLLPPPELHLEMYFKKDVWLKLTADGQLKFEGRVPADTRQVWKAKKTMIFSSSNAGELTLILNGSRYALPAPDESGNYNVKPFPVSNTFPDGHRDDAAAAATSPAAATSLAPAEPSESDEPSH